MGVLRRYADAFHNGNRQDQYQAIIDLDNHLDYIYHQTGIPVPTVFDSPGASSAKAVPPACDFNVVGIDGKFVVYVTPPNNVVALSPKIAQQRFVLGTNPLNTLLLHQLQSGFDLNFNNASNFKDYGVSSQLVWTDQDPNVTRFFRLRSSYDGKNWNAWKFFASALTCGPVGVWSGLQRSVADHIVNVASTLSGTSILTQSGTSTRINVASTTFTTPGQSLVYASGFVDPGAYGKYYVYWLDPKRLGGVVTYIATLSPGDLTAQDGTLTGGAPITTSGGGGGTGGGGGGTGGCTIAGSLIDMPDGSTKPVEELRKRMKIRNPLGDAEEILRMELVPACPCFTAETERGEVLRGFSNTHGLKYAGAGLVSGVDLVEGDQIQWRGGTRKIMKKTFLGMRTVYRLELHGPTKLYVADGAVAHNFLKF